MVANSEIAQSADAAVIDRLHRVFAAQQKSFLDDGMQIASPKRRMPIMARAIQSSARRWMSLA